MKTLKYILSIGLAASVGVAIGILTAPRSGKRTRKQLLNEYEETKAALNDAANKKINEAKELLNESVQKQIDQGKSVLNKVQKELISK